MELNERNKTEKKQDKTGMVQYDNKLNEIRFMDIRSFPGDKLDLFFTLFSNVLEKGTELIEIPINQLGNATNTNRHGNKYRQWVSTVCDEIVSFKIRIEFENGDKTTGVLFPTCKYVSSEDKVIVRVNKDFAFCFNKDWENEGWFTMFELKKFVGLKTTYPKHAFRILKQQKVYGHAEYTVEEFKEELGIPEKYTPAEITRKVLKPIEDEFAEVGAFENFKIEPIKKGRKITEYHFTWKKENPKQDGIDKKTEREKAKLAAKEKGNQQPDNQIEPPKVESNKPNEDELAAFIKENNLIGFTAKLFIAYYDNNGWDKVNDWKAVATLWSERTRSQMELNKDVPMPDWYYKSKEANEEPDPDLLNRALALQKEGSADDIPDEYKTHEQLLDEITKLEKELEE